MENNYLIFNIELNIFLYTDSKSYLAVQRKVEQLKSVLTNGFWDYSNAEWTLKHTEFKIEL